MDARRLQTFAAFRTHAGGAEPSDHLAVLRHAHFLEHENLLHRDDLALHAGDFRDARDLARPVAETRLLHDERFLAAHLADDDAIGPHTQRVDHQLPLANGALPFHVGRTRLEARDVLL